jgi:hypothetical protein
MKRIWKAVKSEPLVHFALIGSLLFAADEWMMPSDRESIVVDRATIDYLVSERESVLLRPPTDPERRETIAAHIDNEILFREALRLQLEKGADSRKLLIRKVRYLFGEDIPEPSKEELRRFFDENIDRYRQAPTIHLELVIFSDPDKDLRPTLASLESGHDFRAFGETLGVVSREIVRVDERELALFLGPAAAKDVFALPSDNWSGPIRSTLGMLAARVVERFPGVTPLFDTVRSYVWEDWEVRRHREIVQAKIANLKQDYQIIIAGDDPQ